MVEVCSGTLGASLNNQIHSVSPRQQWQLVISVDGYEPSHPLLVNHGGSLDGAIFMKKLNDTFELKPLPGSGNRVLRLNIANRLRQGTARELTLYAPYWLVNQTDLPLAYREVHLGTGLLNTVHAMEGRTDAAAASATPAPAPPSPRNSAAESLGSLKLPDEATARPSVASSMVLTDERLSLASEDTRSEERDSRVSLASMGGGGAPDAAAPPPEMVPLANPNRRPVEHGWRRWRAEA